MRSFLVCAILGALLRPAFAGPPYVSDDPEPTDYKHFEIYAFSNGTTTKSATDGEAGIDFNYGAAPDLQLTATLPSGFDRPAGGKAVVGLGNIELAAKYRFLHQATFGLDVAIFPRVFLPSGSGKIGDNHTSLLLPLWVQKDWGSQWSTFGGGGCVVSGQSSQDFCLMGGVLAYQILPKLQIGIELFHQTADASGTPATSSLGLGVKYDLNDTFHLLAYVRRGIQDTDQTDQLSWYTSVLFTF
ncbi:MAG TPA: transporter [Pseudolabrys sp.]|jgi:hypothetical protein|nr:transporter [Pseudolabrys sp.]